MNNETQTHSDLIELAASWLRAKGHSVVVTDMTSGTSETPDAIGFGYRGKSTLIECKASRADFLADKHKPFRRMPDMGMGRDRYYCAPRGMIRAEELPAGWGLLESFGGKLKKAAESTYKGERNWSGEMGLLMTALRRVGQTCPKGVSVKAYTFETKNRATLGVELLELESL